MGATASRRTDAVVARPVAQSLYQAAGRAASFPDGSVVRHDELLTAADAVNTLMVFQKKKTGKDYKIVFG